VIPEIRYVTRVPLEMRRGEGDAAPALERALTELSRRMVAEGGPELRRASGDGRPDTVLVSIGTPWQQVRARIEQVEKRRSFIYTPKIERGAAARAANQEPAGRRATQESVIGVVLDGRAVARPYGKRARRADLVILSATIDGRMAQAVERALRRGFHAHDLQWRSSAAVNYAALRSLYPHQSDLAIIEAAGENADVALVRAGILTDAFSLPSDSFSTAADRPAAPHVAFLLSDDDASLACARRAAGTCYAPASPADEPPAVIALTPGHLTDRVRTRGEGYGDTLLGLLALYQAENLGPRGKGG
jgi:hypothetical protein